MASAAFGVAVGHAVGEAATGVVALPPFAGLMTDVTALGQEPGQGGHGVDEGHAFLHLVTVCFAVASLGRHGRFVAGDFVLVRVKAGDHRRERGAAEAGWHVAALEQAALLGQAIDVWRLDGFVAHETVVRPRLVVGDNENDVWLFGRDYVGGQQQGGDESKERAFHVRRNMTKRR